MRRLQRLPTSPLYKPRHQSTYQAPDPPQSQQKPNPHGNFYKTFGRPLAKTFLIAVATYQVLYVSWLKLESIETKRDKEAEMRSLKVELQNLTERERPGS
ncbi:hypothetical protein LTR53_016927 [Teratosphaeriaceae sp. CCFEE 6253]|nr:hypothetical protein LTR53_016927 [Teratosphaeriaceae sp. CCFEE 6253]